MENQKVIDILRECGSLLEGHFLLSSGKHSNRYCQCAQLLQYPDKAREVGEVILSNIPEDVKVDIVVGPAMGGIVIGYELARQLNVKSVFTERVDGEMTFRRGFALSEGDQVIIAEDVVTTGKSTLETARAIEAQGAKVVGVTCIVDRRNADTVLPFPVFSATTIAIDTYEADNCKLCQDGIEIYQPGSRKMK